MRKPRLLFEDLRIGLVFGDDIRDWSYIIVDVGENYALYQPCSNIEVTHTFDRSALRTICLFESSSSIDEI